MLKEGHSKWLDRTKLGEWQEVRKVEEPYLQGLVDSRMQKCNEIINTKFWHLATLHLTLIPS